jgi:HEAT repeat protein
LVGRLRSEKHEQVRRAVARALAKTDDERAHRALRRALQKDKSYDVRADAAGSLGRLCDEHSVTLLTAKAQMLLQKGLSEGQIKVSLAALSALIQIAPPDLDARIAPLRSSDAPGLLRNQVETALLRTSSSCGGK